MKKLRKSLAVLLAIIMLASFTPLFASAATAASKTNCVIVEYPQFSYTDPTTNETVTTDATNTNITVPYGTTFDEINFVGGKITYNDTVVEGYFDWASAYLTRTPDVGVQTSYRLYFYPTDTTTYSRGTWRVTDITGWPTITVNGLDGTLVEAPTATAILTGQMLSAATLSGGVVNDADGNAVTGTWSYVYPTSYPSASGKYEVQFTATGYNALKTTVDVTVTSNGNATATEVPTTKRTLVGKTLRSVTLIGGKVVDDNGAEITTGTWSWINDDTQSTSAQLNTTGTFTYKAQWVALGYPVLTVDIPVLVAEDMGYTVTAPTLAEEIPFVTGLTYGTLPFVFGEASVPGTYTIAKADTKLTQAHSTKTYNTTVTFTPEDLTLEASTWSFTFKIIYNSVWKLPDYPEKITLPYGFQHNSISKFSAEMPQEFKDAGLNNITWDTAEFNAADHDAGYIQLVNVKISHNSVYYNISTDQIYIQIEPRVYEGDFCKITNMNPDRFTGETIVTVDCNIPGITGEVQVKANGETFATLKPDENGYIYEKVYFTPKTSGDYTFSATYVPNVLDKATVVNTEVTGSTVTIDIPELRKLTVYVANQKFEYDVYGNHSVSHSWSEFSMETPADVFEYWLVTDGNGNEVTVESLDTSKHNLQFNMPEHDLVLTAKGAIEDTIAADGSIGGSLWSFWQKLVDWLVSLYRTIVELLIPTVETF